MKKRLYLLMMMALTLLTISPDKIYGNENTDDKVEYIDAVDDSFTRLEKLTIEGNSFVSDIVMDGNSRYELSCSLARKDVYGNLLDVQTSSGNTVFRLRQEQGEVYYAYGWMNEKLLDFSENEKMIISQDKNHIYVNEQEAAIAVEQELGEGILTFGSTYMDFYEMKVWQNDTLVAEYIPILDDKKIPCLYNTITKTCLYNNAETASEADSYQQEIDTNEEEAIEKEVDEKVSENTVTETAKVDLYAYSDLYINGVDPVQLETYPVSSIPVEQLEYTSENPDIVEVSEKGILTPKATGKTRVTISYEEQISVINVYTNVTPAPDIKEAQEDGWYLVWEDQFSEDDIDHNKWYVQTESGEFAGNGSTVFRDENVEVKDDLLIIHNKIEEVPFSFIDSKGKNIEGTAKYTSGRVGTYDFFKYGKFEVRAKCATANGTNSAIWMCGRNEKGYWDWPFTGEIDIVETFNNREWGETNTRSVTANLHLSQNMNLETYDYKNDYTTYDKLAGARPQYVLEPTEENPNPKIGDEFRTYVMEWDEEHMDFYCDGTLYGTINITDESYSAFRDYEFQMILSDFMGGFEGIEVEGPSTFEIDYVKIYQKPGCYKNGVAF